MKSLIYDFETLGTNARESVVISLAALAFDSSFFGEPGYTYEELLENAVTVKFDVADQVRTYGRKIDQDTLNWWSEQSEEAQKQLKPAADDMPIANLHAWLTAAGNPAEIKRIYTRGNTFDPMFLESLLGEVGKKDPYPFYNVRDTRSTIEGMTLLNKSIGNSFMVPGLEDKFVAHDAKHDVAMDVMRMQYLVQEMI